MEKWRFCEYRTWNIWSFIWNMEKKLFFLFWRTNEKKLDDSLIFSENSIIACCILQSTSPTDKVLCIMFTQHSMFLRRNLTHFIDKYIMITIIKGDWEKMKHNIYMRAVTCQTLRQFMKLSINHTHLVCPRSVSMFTYHQINKLLTFFVWKILINSIMIGSFWNASCLRFISRASSNSMTYSFSVVVRNIWIGCGSQNDMPFLLSKFLMRLPHDFRFLMGSHVFSELLYFFHLIKYFT